MQQEPMIDDACGWALAGTLTELEAAVLTTSVGDGGLAGTIELLGPFGIAANDASFGKSQGEQQ